MARRLFNAKKLLLLLDLLQATKNLLLSKWTLQFKPILYLIESRLYCAVVTKTTLLSLTKILLSSFLVMAERNLKQSRLFLIQILKDYIQLLILEGLVQQTAQATTIKEAIAATQGTDNQAANTE